MLHIWTFIPDVSLHMRESCKITSNYLESLQETAPVIGILRQRSATMTNIHLCLLLVITLVAHIWQKKLHGSKKKNSCFVQQLIQQNL